MTVRSGNAMPDYGPRGVDLLSRIRARAAQAPTKAAVDYADIPAAERAAIIQEERERMRAELHTRSEIESFLLNERELAAHWIATESSARRTAARNLELVIDIARRQLATALRHGMAVWSQGGGLEQARRVAARTAWGLEDY